MYHKTITQPTWYIFHNGVDVFHHGYIENGNLSTGQPNVEIFENEQDYIDRCAQLNIPPQLNGI